MTGREREKKGLRKLGENGNEARREEKRHEGVRRAEGEKEKETYRGSPI